MTAVLLSVHVLAAILTIGPVTVTASMFPPALRAGLAGAPAGALPDPGGDRARTLHRICRTYAAAALAVPAFGLATAASLGVLTDPWVVVSVALTAIAAVLLVARVLPLQRQGLDQLAANGPGPEEVGAVARRLGMTTGIFNLLWAVVVVLMIVRPGSTTDV